MLLKLTHDEPLSNFAFNFNMRRYIKGVFWSKQSGKWRAECKRTTLGYHATEEAAARAYDDYVKDGVVPEKLGNPKSTSQFKGVGWSKSAGKWKAICKGKHLGYHATEEAAAQAYNTEAERIGGVDLNVIPPAGDADDGDNTAAPAALALLSMFASAPTHANSAGSKRAGAPTAPAPRQRKMMRLDTLVVTVAGAGAAAATATRGSG